MEKPRPQYSNKNHASSSSTLQQRDPSSVLFANNHLLACIFGYLDHVDLCLSCSLVCRKWKDEAEEDALWFMLYFTTWGPNASSAVATASQTQQQPRQHHQHQQQPDKLSMRRELQKYSRDILQMKWKQHYTRKHIIERSFGPAVSRLLSNLSCFKEPYVSLLLAEADRQLPNCSAGTAVPASTSWYKKELSVIRQHTTPERQPQQQTPPSSVRRGAASGKNQSFDPFLFKALTLLCAVREQSLILLLGGAPNNNNNNDGLPPQQHASITEERLPLPQLPELPFVAPFLKLLSDTMPFIYQCINRLVMEITAATPTSPSAATSPTPIPFLDFHRDIYALVQTGLPELVTNVETAATNAAATATSRCCPSGASSTLVTEIATQILGRFLFEPPAAAPEQLRLLRQKAQESMDRLRCQSSARA